MFSAVMNQSMKDTNKSDAPWMKITAVVTLSESTSLPPFPLLVFGTLYFRIDTTVKTKIRVMWTNI
jgi:hypothetical protein